jgi:type IV pilus assembly protein PilC
MPTFKYEAMTSDGEVVKDQVRARNTDEAVSILRDRNLFPTKVKEVSEKKAQEGGGGGGRRAGRAPMSIGSVGAKHINMFTRQFATLIDAGVPVVQSVDTLRTQVDDSLLEHVLACVADEVEGGASLSEAMANHPKAFDRLYVNMVRAGETGGVLDQVMQRLAEFREKAADLKRRVLSALIYPACVLTVAVGIIAVIMIYVVPKFKAMFEDMGISYPLPTQMLFSFSDYAATYWYLVPAVPIGLYAFGKVVGMTRTGSHVIDWIKLKIPLIGPIVHKSAIARFTRTLGTLLGSGVPILEALEISRETAGNSVLAHAIEDVSDGIQEGEPMARPLGQSGACDEMVVNMVEVGEETGTLDTMLERVADNYDDQVDASVDRLTTAMEPIMVVVLGCIVGFIVVSLFLPLIKMMSELS